MLSFILSSLCAPSAPQVPSAPAEIQTLPAARAGFKTTLVRRERIATRLEVPPQELFSLVTYAAPSGPSQAYLSRIHGTRKRPGIVWLTGGFPAARGGSYVWTRGAPENEQSAAAFRDAGVVMLFPTVRGTAGNPGDQELMLGEVDDVIAAARYLASLEQVDPERLYLGGHSTGGTLALLVAESTDLFRAVFSFGPVAEFAGYGTEDPWPFERDDPEEWRLRAPVHFLDGVVSPTIVIEGAYGNSADLRALDEATENPALSCVEIPHADHFTPLAAVNRWLARRVSQHREGPFTVRPEQVLAAYRDFWRREREQQDLRRLVEAFDDGLELGDACRISTSLRSWKRERVEAAAAFLAGQGFEVSDVREEVDAEGDVRFVSEAGKRIDLGVEALFEASAWFTEARGAQRLGKDTWRLARLRDT
jgi:alpha/beta superfamily hydrolase